MTLRAGDTYRGLWWRGSTLVGAVLYGDVAESAFFLRLIASGAAVASRAEAALGSAWAEDMKDAA